MKYSIGRMKLLFVVFILSSFGLFVSCKKDIKGVGVKPTSSFTVTPIAGAVNKYLLTSTSQNAFLFDWDKANGKGYIRSGTTDTAYFPKKGSYTVKLLAYGPGGIDSALQTISVTADDPAGFTTFDLLTLHGWKLDPDPTANAVIVGTESNPGQYYGGGPLASCQTDDIYRFSANNTLMYNANGATFNGGNVAPNYVCGSDRSYNNVAFTYTESVGAGLSGIATITLSGTPPTNFIGTTDVPNENIYRIISISPTNMVLRASAGTPGATVFQFKFIAQ